MKQVQKTLGATVQRLRKEQGFSQEEFAYTIGVTQAYISRVERGVANPQLDKIKKIAVGLGLSLPDLLQFDKDGAPPQAIEAEEKAQRLLRTIQVLPLETTEKIYDALAAQIKRK